MKIRDIFIYTLCNSIATAVPAQSAVLRQVCGLVSGMLSECSFAQSTVRSRLLKRRGCFLGEAKQLNRGSLQRQEHYKIRSGHEVLPTDSAMRAARKAFERPHQENIFTKYPLKGGMSTRNGQFGSQLTVKDPPYQDAAIQPDQKTGRRKLCSLISGREKCSY